MITNAKEITGTGAGTVSAPPTPIPTNARLAYAASEIRDQVKILESDAHRLHREVLRRELDDLTGLIGRVEPPEILEELASDWGLGWSTIARMVGVTDTAVRKWRRGDAVTPENRRRLARCAAFLQLIKAQYPIGDPASWLEMAISDDADLTPVSVYAAKRFDLLLEYAGGRISPSELLDQFDPDWQVNHGVDRRFKVVDTSDGDMSIVMES